MWWISIILALGLLLLFAYGSAAYVFHLARSNCLRLDGSYSTKRTRRELRRFGDLVVELLLLPFAVLMVICGAVLVVHHFVMPVDMIRDLFSIREPDPGSWANNPQIGELGNVGIAYQQWREAQGLLARDDPWRAFLSEHWATLGVLAGLLGLAGYWFVVKYWRYTMARYRRGVLRRRRLYRSVDQGIDARKVLPVHDADFEVL